MHTTTVPPLLRTLGALDSILAKTESHCEAQGIDPMALLNFRLFPDMLPFTRQIQLACDFAARMGARLSGAEVPSFPDVETTIPELRARIAAARDYLASLPASGFDGAAERQITIKTRVGDMTMDGVQFQMQYAFPQVYFHAATAYNILRHNGVPLGKRDFMGA